MAIGPRDLSTLVLHTGWDATVLANFQLSDGVTVDQVFARMNAALAALNAELRSGLWGSVSYFTDQPTLEYRVGGESGGMQKHTEYGRPDARRASSGGHMLPLVPWDDALAWTWDYLKKARNDQIEADFANSIRAVRSTWRTELIGRILQRGDDSGTNSGLGASGYSPGFATDAGSTNVDFIPPAYGSSTFDNTHEHYVGIAGGVFTNAVFEDATLELSEHGHEPPFDFWISPSDRATVAALTKFTASTNQLVTLGSTQDRANVGPEYIGVIEDFRVRVVYGMPQYYGFGFKSYGQGSTRNPLVVRLEKGMTTPTVMAMQDPRNGSMAHPLQYMMNFLEFGVGVNDRTNGTVRYVNSATWADGTAT